MTEKAPIPVKAGGKLRIMGGTMALTGVIYSGLGIGYELQRVVEGNYCIAPEDKLPSSMVEGNPRDENPCDEDLGNGIMVGLGVVTATIGVVMRERK